MDRSDDGSPTHAFSRADALPPYAFVLTEAAKARVVAAGADLIDLGLGNPDRAPRQAILDVLQEHVSATPNHRYHPGAGLPELRRALSRWYTRRYGVAVDAESEVVVCLGAKEGISHFCFAALGPGDVVVAPDPCYPIHVGGPRIAGAEVEPYAARSDLAPADAVAEAIERVRARGARPKLVIANYPQNPTGRGVTREELRDLVRVVQRSSAMLLHDLAYADVDFRARFAPSIFDCGVPPDEVKRFAVEVTSMSKSYNVPGWRVGFVVGNARMVGALSLMKSYLDYGGFVPLQHAAAWALDHGDAFVGELRELYQARATALVGGLRSAGFLGITDPTGAMFVWAPLPEAWRARGSLAAATDAIERAHVATSPGVGFGPGGEGYLRFALIEDEPRIGEACERLRRWVSG